MRGVVVINIHGCRVEDYRKTIGKLHIAFKGLEDDSVSSEMLVYHADTARQARQMNPDTARRLAERITRYQAQGDTVIVCAHSNANTILRLAFDLYMASPDVALCIQPALPSDVNPSPNASVVRVYWNPEDDAVRLGKVLTWITRWVSPEWALARNWGEMGCTGYTGLDDNVANDNTMLWPVMARDHSGIFHGQASRVHLPKMARWAVDQARQLQSSYGEQVKCEALV